MRLIRLAIAGALTVIVFWGVSGAVLCESALRVPKRTPPSQPHPVQIEAADGVKLHGSFLRAPDSSQCALVLHGIADTRAIGFAPMLLQAGYSVLAPDIRGHGLSGGELMTFGLRERWDALRWARWMRSQGCTRIVGLGESLGAAILIQASAEEPEFDAIVAECAFRDLPSVAKYRVAQVIRGPSGWGRLVASAVVPAAVLYARVRHSLDLRDASPESAAPRSKSRLLLIHGTEDANTPADHSKAIAAAAPGADLWLVPGAAHTAASAKAPEEFWRRVLVHFRQAG